MTDLDAIRRLFADAVFSGIWEPIAPEALDAFAELEGFPVPGAVMVVQAEAGNAVLLDGVRELRLHEGMVYLCVPPAANEVDSVIAALSARRLVHGEALVYSSSRDFLWQLREAIVSLRQRQLHWPEGSAAGRAISYQEEVQSSALALRELRQTGRPGAACEAWLDLVFVRHQKHLHQLRLRLFEMLGALSATVDGTQQQGYVVQAGLRRMLESYALPQLRQACRGALSEAAALVVLSGANADSGAAALVESSPLIGRALKFIQARFAEPISLAEVARAVHASPEHLAREFRRRTGRTVIEALQLLRINHARQLLAESDRTILDIAFSSGFESAEHFYRTFKKLTGTTPRTYRLRHGG